MMSHPLWSDPAISKRPEVQAAVNAMFGAMLLGENLNGRLGKVYPTRNNPWGSVHLGVAEAGFALTVAGVPIPDGPTTGEHPPVDSAASAVVAACRAVADYWRWVKAGKPDTLEARNVIASYKGLPMPPDGYFALYLAYHTEHPIDSSWAEAYKAALAEIEAQREADREAAQLQWDAGAPARALASAEAEGVTLMLDKTGKHIVAPANHALSAAALAQLREHKAGVVAILAARAAAAAPAVIA